MRLLGYTPGGSSTYSKRGREDLKTSAGTRRRHCILNDNRCANGVFRRFCYSQKESLSNCNAGVKELRPLRHRRRRRRRRRRLGWLGFNNKPPAMFPSIAFRLCSPTTSTRGYDRRVRRHDRRIQAPFSQNLAVLTWGVPCKRVWGGFRQKGRLCNPLKRPDEVRQSRRLCGRRDVARS